MFVSECGHSYGCMPRRGGRRVRRDAIVVADDAVNLNLFHHLDSSSSCELGEMNRIWGIAIQ